MDAEWVVSSALREADVGSRDSDLPLLWRLKGLGDLQSDTCTCCCIPVHDRL